MAPEKNQLTTSSPSLHDHFPIRSKKAFLQGIFASADSGGSNAGGTSGARRQLSAIDLTLFLDVLVEKGAVREPGVLGSLVVDFGGKLLFGGVEETHSVDSCGKFGGAGCGGVRRECLLLCVRVREGRSLVRIIEFC